MKLLLENFRFVFPEQNIDETFSLFLVNGIIKQIIKEESILNEIRNLADKIIIGKESEICVPGFFDMHVHFRYPGQTHKEDLITGSMSAMNGGFTGVVCMPNTSPCIDNSIVIQDILTKSKSLKIEVLTSAAITKGRKGLELSDMNSNFDAGAILFTDDGDPVHNPNMMAKAFQYSQYYDLLLSQHCEETEISSGFGMNESELSFKLGLKGYPSVAEELILSRDILLSKYYGKRRYHAQHLSTKGSIKLIEYSKNENLRVSSEVAPHHFSLTHDNLNTYDSNFKMNPPLRSQDDVDYIIEGIKNGTIDCIATDHAPHSIIEKSQPFINTPNGIIGLETSIGISLDTLYHKNNVKLNRIIEMMSINPRKLLNLDTVMLEIDKFANFTLINLNEEWNVQTNLFQSKSKNSPYNGTKLKGKPKYTIFKDNFLECNL